MTDSTGRDCTILVAQADEASRNSIRFALQAEGYAVSVFPDGWSLLAAPRAAAADAYVLDHNLPDMTGPDLLRALRAAGARGRAAFLAGRVSPTLARDCAALGAPILHKPLIGDALSAGVADLLAAAPH